MAEKEDGGSAFPLLDHNGHTLVCREFGMTLRDWFAGQALARIAESYQGKAFSPNGIAKSAYTFADAMLEARK